MPRSVSAAIRTKLKTTAEYETIYSLTFLFSIKNQFSYLI
jgi:hypothetical protein